MRTKPNYEDKSFEATFDKPFKTQSGLTFILKREEDIENRKMEVFGTDIRIHIANVGCAIFFRNEPRDEGELEYIPFESNGSIAEEVYSMIKNEVCV